jgi:hypothetical protein
MRGSGLSYIPCLQAPTHACGQARSAGGAGRARLLPQVDRSLEAAEHHAKQALGAHRVGQPVLWVATGAAASSAGRRPVAGLACAAVALPGMCREPAAIRRPPGAQP